MSSVQNDVAVEHPDEIAGTGRVSRLLRRASLVGGSIAGIGYLALMILTITDVSLRESGLRGVLGSVETIEVSMAALVYLGMSSAEFSGTHVRTPMLTNRMPPMAANLARAVTLSISTLFIGWLAYQNLLRAISSFNASEHRFALINIPVWPSRIVLVIGLVLFVLVLLAECWRAWQRFARREASLQREIEGMP